MIQTSENYYLLNAINIDDCIDILTQQAQKYNHFHTEISPETDTLICLNPFKNMPQLFSSDLMRQYYLKEIKSPHLFKYATRALESLLDPYDGTSQAILVTGESGSGKTSSINYLVSYFSHITQQSSSECSIEKLLLYTNPILEAFGNASTIQNENSSRFGKFIELKFNSTKKVYLKSVKITTYLLEKTRACRVPDTKSLERNFHIFYQIAAGASDLERHEWLLDSQISSLFRANQTDLINWTRLKESFQRLNISNSSEIFKLISFTSNLLVSSLDLTNAARLLGFDNSSSLDSYLAFQQLTIRDNLVKRMCSLAEARLRKDALIKLVYSKIFIWIVNELNRKFPFHHEEKYIGLVDIYGFENLTLNSFEQLCINYANEKLHQLFVRTHLKLAQEECVSELVDWTPIKCDNNDLLNQLEFNKHSLFTLLNEECMLRRDITSRRGSDQAAVSLLDKIVSAGHQFISDSKPRKHLSFTIRHYAGHVDYKIDEFIEKNKDQIPDDLTLFLSKSKNAFLLEILADELASKKEITFKKKTVLDKFKLNLTALVSKLEETHIYYVRCVRPNKLKQSDYFDRDLIRNQLDASGLTALIDLEKRFAFRHKIDYVKFCNMYSPLIVKTKCSTSNDLKRLAETILKLVEENNSKEQYRLGKTKIFLNETLKSKLNTKLEMIRFRSALTIQTTWRMHVKRSEFKLKRLSVVRLQKWFRTLARNRRDLVESNSTTSTLTLFSCSSNE